MFRPLDIATSIVTSVVRLGSGANVGPIGPRPAQLLELYEFEGCPFCRKVREALTILDLDASVRPCPKRGTRFRPDVVRRGGRELFPYLIDPNTGKAMYESDDIVGYLFREYGAGPPPTLITGPIANATSAVAGLARLAKGSFARASRTPEVPLVLWSYEASPFCRIAREALCSLELPYTLHNVGKGSAGREALVARSGKMQVPYLADPNTGIELLESADIVAYLEETYGA